MHGYTILNLTFDPISGNCFARFNCKYIIYHCFTTNMTIYTLYYRQDCVDK